MTPYDEGWAAFEAGIKEANCPHEPGSSDYDEWRYGWNCAADWWAEQSR